MIIQRLSSNDQIIDEIGKRMKYRRIELNLTQKQLESNSGVSKRTISGFENGENISLDNLISLLKSLGLVEDLNLVFPEKKVNPFDVLKLGHTKKRASRKPKQSNDWEWGE